MPQEINFFYPTKPYSADPLEYDYSAHHVMYRSSYMTLTSIYASKGPTGMLAESWSSSESKDTWSLKLKKSVVFGNGDLISPEVVLKSLTRIAFMLKNKGSNDGFLDKLQGYDKITSITSAIAGITIDGEVITFKFSQPIPTFLNFISFGIYGITHPSDYDNEGKWKSGLKPISSGAYSVAEASENQLILNLRKDFPTSFRS